MATFQGFRDTASWVTDQRPKNWREGLLLLNPNGTAPLFAMTSLMKKEKVDDPEYNWFTKTLERRGITITAGTVDTDLADTAYTSGGVAGDVLHVTGLTAAKASEFLPGYEIMFQDASHPDMTCVAKVTSVVSAGAASYITVSLLEADNNGSATDLSNADTIVVIGNINPEFGERPESLHYQPTKNTNYTQIFRDSLDLSRTTLETRLRTGDAYKEEKRETLQYHSQAIEMAMLFGVKSEGTGANGKKERTTDGLVTMVKNGSGVTSDWTTDGDYGSGAWSGGTVPWEWLNDHLEELFRFGGDTKMAFCGSGVLTAIQQLAEKVGTIQVEKGSTSFGLNIREIITPHGILALKTHPLFNNEATLRNSLVAFEPGNIRYRFVTDTSFRKDPSSTSTGSDSGLDGRREEYITECGLEYHHFPTAAWLTGFGNTHL